MAKNISLDPRTVKKLERALKTLNTRGVVFAQRNTLNDLAFKARDKGREEISDNFTERNKFTRNSLRVRKAQGRDLVSVMGSTQQYLADQEEGFTRSPIGIPTSAAAGQSGNKRTKVVKKINRRNSVRFKRRNIKAANNKQLVAAQIALAKRDGERFAFLSINKAEGIYKINKSNIRMIYDMSRQSTVTAATPWLSNTAKKTGRTSQVLYARNLTKQLRRIGFV